MFSRKHTGGSEELERRLEKMPVEQNKMAAICEPARCLAADPKRKLSLCMYEASKDDLIVTDVKLGIAAKRRVEGVT